MVAAQRPGRRRRPGPRQLNLDFERAAARLAAFARKVASPPPPIEGPERLGDVLARMFAGDPAPAKHFARNSRQ
ncbi:MAG: hypothetical protein WBC44_03815 [Planctomycetaceae bacterium]